MKIGCLKIILQGTITTLHKPMIVLIINLWSNNTNLGELRFLVGRHAALVKNSDSIGIDGTRMVLIVTIVYGPYDNHILLHNNESYYMAHIQ